MDDIDNKNNTHIDHKTNDLLQNQESRQIRGAAATEEEEEEAAAHHHHHHHHHQDEEALSLSGLILNSPDEAESQDRGRSSSADLSELFEFFNDDHRNSSDTMSHAEDIIFCGKLIPYKERHPSKNHQFLIKHPTRSNDKKQSFHSRRSESLNDLRTGRSNSTTAREQHQFMRNSRSLDYQKLYGNNNSSSRWSENLEIERSLSSKSTVGSKEKIPRPRWYMMMFGVLKFPPEMDFQDIKNRQVRRNPGTLFASAVVDGDGKALVNRVDRRRCSSSWDFLRVLSCKDHASVAVTTPFGCLQHI